MKKRLANVKTRDETGFSYVMQSIQLQTPFGIKRMKETKPYFPGEETLLREEYKRLSSLLVLAREESKTCDGILQALMEIKDIQFTIERSENSTLSVVEIFEVKSLLLKMDRIDGLVRGAKIPLPEDYDLENVGGLLETLDPRNDRMDTFYLYDEFSEVLTSLRKEKRAMEIKIRSVQKEQKQIIKQKYGIELTPKFEFRISKASGEQIRMIREIPELVQENEDYISVTFTLKNTEVTDELQQQMEEIYRRIEEEELTVREILSKEISKYKKILLENCMRIGRLDVALGKAVFALEHHCVIPEIVQEHIVEIHEGRHLQLEALLMAKNKEYCPITIALSDGVTCITGANMGGKTISLKLTGLVAMLAQYGFFVPCKWAAVGLSNYIQILIGDNQSMERGLSSFGSEMEGLKEILDGGKPRSLLLIDEIASGTNPAEGMALTKSLVGYLKKRPYMSLITTHFDRVTEDPDIRKLQVIGLANANFDRLDKEIRYASRKDRITIISKYMDYRLREIGIGREIPRDALNIAKMLGIHDEIIENARMYLNHEKEG